MYMSSPISFPALLASGRVAIAGARAPSPEGVGPVVELIARVDELVPGCSEFALARALAVYSPLHLLAAVQGAWQGLAEGTAAARDLGGETARYLSAERQVGQALGKSGLKADTREVALVLVLTGSGGEDEPEGKEEADIDDEPHFSYPAGSEAGVANAMDGRSQAGRTLSTLISDLGWIRDDSLLKGARFDPEAFGLKPGSEGLAHGKELERRVMARCALVPLFK